jgi:hypothetical protein
MQKNNEHFIPAPVREIRDELSQAGLNRNVKKTLLDRMKIIRDYCDEVLTKHNGNDIFHEAETFKRMKKK